MTHSHIREQHANNFLTNCVSVMQAPFIWVYTYHVLKPSFLAHRSWQIINPRVIWECLSSMAFSHPVSEQKQYISQTGKNSAKKTASVIQLNLLSLQLRYGKKTVTGLNGTHWRLLFMHSRKLAIGIHAPPYLIVYILYITYIPVVAHAIPRVSRTQCRYML